MDTRIPIEEFSHYPTARIGGYGSIRWIAAMEAFEASIAARAAARKAGQVPTGTLRERTDGHLVGVLAMRTYDNRGRIGPSALPWPGSLA